MTAVHQGARMTMTMRAFQERNSTATTDAYGHPDGATWGVQATLPCRVWSKRREEVIDGRKVALSENLRCAVPIGTDITELDRLSAVKDRLGAVVWAGPLVIMEIQHKHSHLELHLRRDQS